MEHAITAAHLSKMYHIGRNRSGSVRETIMQRSFSFFSKQKNDPTEFWALKDVSFDVQPGEVLGIIGKNGAGKSTLLKILSRITDPTEGRVVINGRVSSLLEVGTGFHPELTGRENIFLNGAILGMKRAEIKNKFDEIVSFSGIEQFIDTPVKRYSSGMYVRLAFAVAAHLEPEILIVDEVLAVGDAEFQKKCLGKMKDVSEQKGRTVLFVSHNMSAVNSLCTRCILMKNGKIDFTGNVEDVTAHYLQHVLQSSNEKKWESDHVQGDGVVRPVSIHIINEEGNPLNFILINKASGIEFTYEILQDTVNIVPNFHVFTANGDTAFTAIEPTNKIQGKPGIYKTIMWIPPDFLNEGFYRVGVAVSTFNPATVHFSDYDALSIEVIDSLDAITRNNYTGHIRGAVRPLLKWETIKQT
jgi:lipopolysaccharide transport system ATP-binding protein